MRPWAISCPVRALASRLLGCPKSRYLSGGMVGYRVKVCLQNLCLVTEKKVKEEKEEGKKLKVAAIS